ncbi:AaceriAGR229Wp [[Ashbya] aceris (nom. inval.)]|nr:AaceriAGR229Wp [[Ashbya] aceris (nom. inval.)]
MSTSRRESPAAMAGPADGSGVRINDARLTLAHSPVRGPTEDENGTGDGSPAPKRLKMAAIPRLGQPGGGGLISSPQPIEMVNAEPLALTSPVKRTDDQDRVDRQDVLDIQDDLKAGAAGTPEKEGTFEKMTPVRPRAEARNLRAELEQQGSEGWDGVAALLEDKNRLISSLTEEVRRVQDELWRQTQAREQLQVAACRAAERVRGLEAAEREQRALAAAYDELLGKKEKLEQRAEKLKTRTAELRNELTVAVQNAQILQEKYHEQIGANEELEQQLRDRAEDAQASASRLEAVEAELAALRTELASGAQKLAAAEQDLADARAKQLEAEGSANTLREQLAEREQTIDELRASVEQYKDAQSRSSSELDAKVAELTEENALIEREYQKLLKDYDTETKELGNQMQQLSQEAESWKAKYEADCANLQALHSQHAETSKRAEQLTAELEEVSNDLVSKKAEVAELSSLVEDLRQSEKYLQDSITRREDSLKEWQEKLEAKEDELNRLHAEYESVVFKNGNMEAEHLVELEQLHENMAKFQTMLENLSRENGELKEQLAQASQPDSKPPATPQPKQEEPTPKKEEAAPEQRTPAADPAPKPERASPTLPDPQPALAARIRELEAQLLEKDKDTTSRLQMLAEDLYVQYSSKHEQKVKMLKKSYEVKYQESMNKLHLENSALLEEVSQLQAKLEAERREKQELIKLLDK